MQQPPHEHETQERLLPHSVEVTRNAKGEYQWVIKRYYAEGDPVGKN